MSIINQMLRDIDKRDKKVDGEESSKPSDVYIPKPAQDKRIKFGIAGGGVAIIIVLAIWLGVNPGPEISEAPITSTLASTTTSTTASTIASTETQLEEQTVAESSENGASSVTAEDSYAQNSSLADDSDGAVAINSAAATTVAASTSAQSAAQAPAQEPAQGPAQERTQEPTAPLTQSQTVVAAAPAGAEEAQPRATTTRSATTPSTTTRSAATQTSASSSDMQVTRSGANTGGSAEAAYREGMRELRNANQPGAIQQFRTALERDAMHHEARLELAVLLFSRGAMNEALQLLAAGQQLAPNFNEFRLVEARILVRAGDLEEALQVLNGTSSILPTDADIFILRGSLATELGQYGVAVHSYRELVTWRPNQGTWWLGLGYALEMNGERAEAAEAYRQALRDTRLTAESRRFVMDRREGLSY